MTNKDYLGKLPTAPETGLSRASISDRQQFGENRLTPLPHEPLWKKFIEKFDEPIIKILLAAALLSMVVDLFKGKAYLVGGLSVGLLVVGLIGAYATKLAASWVPSFLFGLALLTFFLGLFGGHVLVEGLAVMVAVILATGVAFSANTRATANSRCSTPRKTPSRSRCFGMARSTRFPSNPWWSATPSCWRWAMRFPPTAGSAGRRRKDLPRRSVPDDR